jgi:hypothetical protein
VFWLLRGAEGLAAVLRCDCPDACVWEFGEATRLDGELGAVALRGLGLKSKGQ